MAKFNYGKMARTATALLSKFGSTIEILNSKKIVLDTCEGVRGSLSDANLPDNLSLSVDGVFFIPSTVSTASIPNYIRSNGVVFKIVASDPIQPGADLVLTKVYVSK